MQREEALQQGPLLQVDSLHQSPLLQGEALHKGHLLQGDSLQVAPTESRHCRTGRVVVLGPWYRALYVPSCVADTV